MKKIAIALISLTTLISMKTHDIRYYDASFYNDKYHGRKTANGETFSQNKRTAASNNYPLGTVVKVTNETNGKYTIVKINDRMAKNYSHRIDLSKIAFKDIAPTSQGVVKKVKVQIVPKDSL